MVCWAALGAGRGRRGPRRSARRRCPRAPAVADSTPSVSSTVASTCAGVVAGEHLGRVGGAGRERLAEPLGRRDRLGLVEELVGVVEPDLDLRSTPAARTASSTSAPVMKAAGRAATRSPTRRHRPRPSTRATSPTCGTLGQKTQRPKSTRKAGSTSSTKPAATTMPIAQARPSPRVVGISESSRVSRPRKTVVALASTASAVRRRARAIATLRDVVGLELVAVAGDQQQGVVGAGAEDEHRQDAGGRAVPGDAEGRHDLGREDGGEPVGDGHDGQRDQPQHRAAVGEQQQQRDDAGGRQQQPHVGAVEDGGEVGLDGRRAGDLGGDARRERRPTPARAGRATASSVACVAASPGPGRRRGRRCRPSTAPASAPSGCRARRLVLQVGELLRRELALVGGVEHDRDRRVVLGQLVAQLGRLRAVGAPGQPRRSGSARGCPRRARRAPARRARRTTRVTAQAVRRPVIRPTRPVGLEGWARSRDTAADSRGRRRICLRKLATK